MNTTTVQYIKYTLYTLPCVKICLLPLKKGTMTSLLSLHQYNSFVKNETTLNKNIYYHVKYGPSKEIINVT